MSLRIAVVVGSLRRESLNRQLAEALVGLAPAGFEFHFPRIDDLPLYSQDDDAQQAETVQRFKNEIAQSQGVIFVTPEYNRSIPGVLKNAIDHGSRPYGKGVWAGKTAAVTGITIGPMGTAMAQQHLRNILAFLDMSVMGQPEAYLQNKPGLLAGNGDVGIPESKEFLQKWMERFCALVQLRVAMQA